MLIVKEKKALLVRSRNPARITALMPRSRQVAWRGKEYVAVSHRVDETRVLRNLGIDAPSPILSYYDWPRGGSIPEPFEAQRETAAFLTLYNRAFVLNSLGTGKTIAALWAYDYLRQVGKLRSMLVVAPLSTLVPTWADALAEHLPHLTFQVLHGTKAKRQKLLSVDADVYIINHDGVRTILDDLIALPKLDLVILDEIAEVARNPRTTRWKTMNALVNQKQRKLAAWGLTGTPTPTQPTDAYGQAKLLVPGTAPAYFTRFRDTVMRQTGVYAWVPRDNANDEVFKLLQPSIRYTRAECVDLPPTTYTDRHVALTADQQQAYDAMHQQLIAEAGEGQIMAVNEGVKVSKLVQIACGVAYGDAGQEVVFGAKPRIQEVLRLVEESASKTLVFVPFIAALHLVVESLTKAGVSVKPIYSGVSKRDRDETFGLFKHQTDPQVLVCQPDAMSHGLTLTSASTIIWYAPTMKPGTYEQANGRITRPGQKHNTLIVHIEGTPIERRIYRRLVQRQQMQGVLLDMVRDQRAVNERSTNDQRG